MNHNEKNDNEALLARAEQLYREKHYKQAFKLFNSLARQGNVPAMVKVAKMYDDVQGVAWNFDQSVHWNMKAIKKGSITALFNLGDFYRKLGDFSIAKKWLEQALDAGTTEAALALAKMYLISDKETERVKYYLEQVIASNNVCETSKEEARQLLIEINEQIDKENLT